MEQQPHNGSRGREAMRTEKPLDFLREGFYLDDIWWTFKPHKKHVHIRTWFVWLYIHIELFYMAFSNLIFNCSNIFLFINGSWHFVMTLQHSSSLLAHRRVTFGYTYLAISKSNCKSEQTPPFQKVYSRQRAMPFPMDQFSLWKRWNVIFPAAFTFYVCMCVCVFVTLSTIKLWKSPLS